jgi:hypothetical protein
MPLEVHDDIVSRVVEQRLRLEGAEKCPNCGHFSLELNFLFEAIDKLEKAWDEDFRKIVKN